MTCVLLLDMFFTAADLARELSDRMDITGGAGGAIVTLEFDPAVTRRDRPGLASASAPGGQARR